MTVHDKATIAVRARLEDFVENALDPQAAAAACLAVADRHQPFTKAGMTLCEECSPVKSRYHDVRWPCPTWTAIAEALGIELPETEGT
jgi:hypothetical protein